jgi:hypothetical protein
MRFVKFGEDMLNIGLVRKIGIEDPKHHVHNALDISIPYRFSVFLKTSEHTYTEFYTTIEEAQARMDALVALANS